MNYKDIEMTWAAKTDAGVAMIEGTLAEIREQLRAIRRDVADIKRMVWKLPTMRQWIVIQIALIVAIGAAALSLLKFAVLY
jgi:hypothetical protein